MQDRRARQAPVQSSSPWLKSYYFTRAAVSVGWIALAFTVGRTASLPAAILLVAYPAWDALANSIDAHKTGGLGKNPSQALNLVVSAVTALGVLVAIAARPFSPLAVFGVWAILAGLLQLATGVRRWRAGGQWAMVLSGVQSAAAGVFLLKRVAVLTDVGAAAVAPYAAFGAFYFLVSAVWLTLKDARSASRPASAPPDRSAAS